MEDIRVITDKGDVLTRCDLYSFYDKDKVRCQGVIVIHTIGADVVFSNGILYIENVKEVRNLNISSDE